MSNRKKTISSIVCCGLTGVFLLVLAAKSLTQIIQGDYMIKTRFSERYGWFIASPNLSVLVVGSIGGLACISRAIALWRKRSRK
jgi:hypothetical protein